MMPMRMERNPMRKRRREKIIMIPSVMSVKMVGT